MSYTNAVDEDAPNLGKGFAAGLGGAVLGAILWAMITAVTNFQIGFMAVGVGILVGYAVRTFGQGDDEIYGYMGGALALFGCLLGNLLADCYIGAHQEHLPFFGLLFHLNFGLIKEIMAATFSPMDLLFYGIAVYEGYKFSILE